MSYAAVANSVIEALVEAPNPNDSRHVFIDVTAADPAPQVGWVYDGMSFAAPVVPLVVPAIVTAAQAKIALSRAGLLTTAQSYIDGLSHQAGIETQIWWNSATIFERNNTILIGVGTALGLTSDQIDALFETAATIN